MTGSRLPRAPAAVRAASGPAPGAGGGDRVVPAFLIVGSTRSGTTLVQRLATELPGVAIPPETHFFTHLAPKVLSASRPLTRDSLRGMLSTYLGLRPLQGLDLDVEGVVDDLGSSCEGPLELFAAILRRLAGPAPLIGEKTPLHLLWWRPIASALPGVKVVGIVREPRAVVASNLAVRWGPGSHLLLAEGWSMAQAVLARAAETLGPDRFLLVRYEDTVADAQATKSSLADFLGLTPPPPGERKGLDAPNELGAAGRPGYLPWENWKERAWGPIQADRVEAWRASLSPRQSEEIAAICRSGMGRFGYEEERPTRAESMATLARMAPMAQARRLYFRAKWRRHARRIERISL